MKTRVTILEKDRRIPIDSYETEKEGDDFDKELNEFQAAIARDKFTPFRFQSVIKEVITIFLILSAIGSTFSCRSVKKTKSKADSTISRTVEAASNWATEVITEFIPFNNPVVSLESDLPGYPSIPVFENSTAVSPVYPYALTSNSNQSFVRAAGNPSVPGYYRQTIRAKGESTNKLEENKQATIRQETKEVESGISTSPVFTGFQIGLILGLIFIVVIIGIIKRLS